MFYMPIYGSGRVFSSLFGYYHGKTTHCVSTIMWSDELDSFIL